MRPQARIILAIGAIILAGLVAYLLMPRTPKPSAPPDVPPQEPGMTTLPVTAPATAPEFGDPFVGLPPAATTTATTAESMDTSSTVTPPGGDRWDDAFNNGRLPTPQPETARGQSPRTYTVQPGDSLYLISQKVFGNTRQVEAIKRANPGVNPSRLRVGQVLKMPEVAAVPAPTPTPGVSGRTGATAPPSLGAARTYKVQPGDNLRKISVKFYGNTGMWRKIYDLNRSAIGSSPDNLRAGMELRLPEGASTSR